MNVKLNSLPRQLAFVLVGMEILAGMIFSMTVLSDLNVNNFKALTYALVAIILTHGALIAAHSKVVSFSFLYFTIMVLYTASAPLLYTINGVIGLSYFRALDLDFLARTIPLVMVGMASYTFGVLSQSGSRRPTKSAGAKELPVNQLLTRSKQAHLLEVIAFSTLVLSISIVLLETAMGRGLSQMLSGSYFDYSEARRSGAQSLLFNISMTRLLPISMITYNALLKSRLRRTNISDVFMFLTLSIPLIAGDRGTVLATLMVWILIHQSYASPISFWKLLLVFVGTLIFIPVMQIVRSAGLEGWSVGTILDLVKNISTADAKFQGELSIAILGPFSPAMMTFMGTLMMIADGESLHFGYDYIMNSVAALPGASSLAPNNSFQMHMFLIPTRQGGPGYMAIAEMYQNFGVPGIIFGHFIIGKFLARTQAKVFNKTLSAREAALLGTLFFALITWVRNEFTSVSQTMFYWWFFFWFLPRISGPLLPRKNGPKR